VSAAFYDVPLLFEKQMEKDFDHILVVSAAEATRLARLIQRTGLPADEIKARWQHHLPPEHKEAQASAVIVNNGDLAALRSALRTVLQRLGVPSPAAAESDRQD
jgi:dephospho-CoA kinase